MNRIVEDNIESIKQLCKNHHVKSFFAFGSVYTEQFNETSDVDLLISFDPLDYADYADNYFLLADKLEAVFKRHVDLVTEKSLSNPYFIDSVNKTKKLIYGY